MLFPAPSALERAFELARSGQVKNVDQIKAKLSREGYDQEQIFGKTLTRQLGDLIRQEAGKQLPLS